MAFHRESGQDLVPVSSRPVQCPNCSNDVPASNVNISSLLAKCDLCGHVIQLADLNAPDEYQVEGLPGGVVEDVSPGSELSLSLSWWDEDIVGLLLFCIFWDGFLVFWYTVAFIGLSRGELDDGWGWAFFFPIVHVAIGCVLTYYVIAGFLNQTVISLTGGRLVVRHRPVRWWGERCLETSDLVGIALERSKSEESMDLTILAHQRDGRKIILLYPRAERQAVYIAQRLAGHLQVPLHRDYVEPARIPHLRFKEAFRRLGSRKKSPTPSSHPLPSDSP